MRESTTASAPTRLHAPLTVRQNMRHFFDCMSEHIATILRNDSRAGTGSRVRREDKHLGICQNKKVRFKLWAPPEVLGLGSVILQLF